MDIAPIDHYDPPKHYVYTNYCAPKVTSSPLHLAAHNGRTARFRALLAEPHENIHRRLADRHYCTPLSVALARGHTEIAAICMDYLERDLAFIEAHFARIGGPQYESRFWLRERILIALGPDHVQYVRENCAEMRAVPAEMSARTGLLILLKASNETPVELVWLTARHSGDDRRIASIVQNIVERGGELHLRQRDMWKQSVFDIAARRNQTAVWMRMHTAFGRYLLSVRDYASSFRYMAEYVPVVERLAHYLDLCRTVGGFEVAELFRGDNEQEQYEVLYDALNNYTGDLTVMDHLIEVAADRVQTVLRCSRPEAISAVIMQRDPQHKNNSLFDATFGFGDNHLPWKCLRYGPQVTSGCEFGGAGLVGQLLGHRHGQHFDDLLHKLIIAQVGAVSGDAFRAIMRELCCKKWLLTVEALWSLKATECERIAGDRDERLALVDACLEAQSYDVFVFVAQEMKLSSSDCLAVLAKWMQSDEEFDEDTVPDVVWSTLLSGDSSRWDATVVAEILCAALRSRHMQVYRRVWRPVDGRIKRTDIVDAAGDSILFVAIYDVAALKEYYFPGRPDSMESEEFIDSEDDETSSALKTASNAERLAWVDEWRPPTVIVNAPLEAEYLQLFEELIAEGADWRQLNADGQNLMHVAVAHNNLPVVRQLLALGLDASLVDTDGNVPMSLAKSPEIIALLPAADALHVNPKTHTTPLSGHVLATRMQRSEDEHIVAALLQAGADVHHRNTDGDTALLLTCSAAVTKRLLDAGADVNAVNNVGESALYKACRDYDRGDVIRVLLAQPTVDPWLRTADGESTMRHLMVRISPAELAAVVPQASDRVEFERLFVDRVGDLHTLRWVHNDSDHGAVVDGIRLLGKLLEDPDVDVHDDDTHWTYDHERLLLECGAHVSQRADKRPLDWSRFPAGGGLLDEIEVFAAAGFAVDFCLKDEGRSALQRYCECMLNDWPQTRYVACLIAVGANYRLRSGKGVHEVDGGWLLDDSVFRSFYEWDKEPVELDE